MYFPWAGFISQLSMADTMIWLDDVEFSRRSFTARVQVKTNQGIRWMSVPVLGQGRSKIISALELADPLTDLRHRSLLKNAFASSVFKHEAVRVFDDAWSRATFLEVLIASSTLLVEAVGMKMVPALRSSEMGVRLKGSARILELVKRVGGTTYITGHGARQYLHHQDFEDAGIQVEYMRYVTLPWSQSSGEFTPYVTGLDLVANVAPEERKEHLASAARFPGELS